LILSKYLGIRRNRMMRRSKHAIISEILDVCRTGACKTRIVYQANLNFRTVNPYIDLLIKNNLLCRGTYTN
jgi:predicted transcriptional regulator